VVLNDAPTSVDDASRALNAAELRRRLTQYDVPLLTTVEFNQTDFDDRIDWKSLLPPGAGARRADEGSLR
jgi:hypothetical protein